MIVRNYSAEVRGEDSYEIFYKVENWDCLLKTINMAFRAHVKVNIHESTAIKVKKTVTPLSQFKNIVPSIEYKNF